MRRSKSWALSLKTNSSGSRWPRPRRTDRQRPLKATAIAPTDPGRDMSRPSIRSKRSRDGLKAVPYRDFAERDRDFAERDTDFADRDTNFAERDTDFADRDTDFAERDTDF